MKNAAIAGALDRWKVRVKEEKDMSLKGSKVVLRWMKMGMYSFFLVLFRCLLCPQSSR